MPPTASPTDRAARAADTATRTLYIARHGAADALGNLLPLGRDQCARLAERLAGTPLDAIWHSPLSRAIDSAAVIAPTFPAAFVDTAEELIDNVPHVPPPAQRSPSVAGLFDGYSQRETDAGRAVADRLTCRFAHAAHPGQRSTHELLITHAYPVAWPIRDALGAPDQAWLSLTGIANTGLTIIQYVHAEPPAVICVNDQSHLAATVTR